MNFSSINIQGNIVSSEILDKIRTDDSFHHQKPEAFGWARGASLRDEIGMSWALIRTHWQTYKKRLEMIPESDTGTSLTRERWIIPFLTELGYEVARKSKKEINGKSYAISHGADNRDDFPIHIMGYKDNLDKRRESGGPRLSPHALVQEYLNNTEHLFALVTNGKHLRLLRDATRLARMSYLEFDLERMMEEELYSDFSILYRVLHVSRMPEKTDEGSESVIEFYHHESLASGSRIREKLSEAVEESIKTLANGFLLHPENEILVQLFSENKISADKYYMQQLRLIYRILFLIVLEERKLVYPDQLDETTTRLRKIYFSYYSIERLRKLTENHVYVDGDKTDLWQSLKTTFLLFENGAYGEKLGIKPLGSGIFSPDAIGILSQLDINNRDLLKVLLNLTTFYNEQKQLVRVNYSDLDVEEFGSVYEGLLEYDPKVKRIGARWEFSFVEGDGRSSSGSHYTPEELVKPLIKHSLDYIIADKVKEANPEEALLSITVCDVACGSGHILLSAARRIAIELASIREGAEQPSPSFYRAALRDVINNCIYGVDYNPLAVELCKVALWLEAHNPGEPLNFLDHHIKCGNSIVGLAHREELEKGIPSEAFKTLPGDDKDFAKTLRDQNNRELKERKVKEIQLKTEFEKSTNSSVQEAMVEYKTFNKLPETTPSEIEKKQKAYDKFINGKGYSFLKAMADTQVAQFFIPKTTDNKNSLMTDAEFRLILSGWQGWQDRKVSNATVVALQKRFFHWFLEFPAIMQNGGFDCTLGNPPFLGGQKLTGTFGNPFAEFIKYNYAPIKSVDLVTYFFRRIYSIIKHKGFLSLISTNTIAQGDARIGGLSVINEKGGTINHAVRSMKWPGLAAVEVSLVTIHKGEWNKSFVLNQKEVNQITSYLDDNIPLGDPYPLKTNERKSFQGSIVLGSGFVLTPKEAKQLIEKNQKNRDVLFPYLNGDDLNNQIDQSPTRWVINFNDWPLRRYTEDEWNDLSDIQQKEIERKKDKNSVIKIAPPNYKGKVAVDYPDCLSIVEKLVQPERRRWKLDENGNEIEGAFALRKPLPERWWHYGEKRPALYSTIAKMDRTMVVAKTAKYRGVFMIKPSIILDQSLTIGIFDSYKDFLIIQSDLCDTYSKSFGTTQETRFRFNVDILESYPSPKIHDAFLLEKIESIGEQHHNYRHHFLHLINLGLTKTYNIFHTAEIQSNIRTYDLVNKNSEEITRKYGKEIWNLWNHLQKTEGTCTWEEAVKGIEELRRLHKEMDEAVLEAYGWHEDTEKWGKAIHLAHDFYEVDYLPENDRIRYTISPSARKEVLKRLLLLNHERYEEEIKQGLHKEKDVEKFYADKGKPVPPNTTYSDKKVKPYKTKSKTLKAKETKGTYGQEKLF